VTRSGADGCAKREGPRSRRMTHRRLPEISLTSRKASPPTRERRPGQGSPTKSPATLRSRRHRPPRPTLRPLSRPYRLPARRAIRKRRADSPAHRSARPCPPPVSRGCSGPAFYAFSDGERGGAGGQPARPAPRINQRRSDATRIGKLDPFAPATAVSAWHVQGVAGRWGEKEAMEHHFRRRRLGKQRHGRGRLRSR
jgi:hypothetical protein